MYKTIANASIATDHGIIYDGKIIIKGIYMEGLYTNPSYGANSHKNPWRHGIVDEEYKALVDACETDVKVWTTAPELNGIEGFYAYARKVNPDVVIAFGHSEATPQRIAALGKYHPTLLTHTMDATGRLPVPSGTRGYGPDEYCFSQPDMYAELISDSYGLHVNAALQQMLLRIKGFDKVVLITDSTKTDAPSPEHLRHITDMFEAPDAPIIQYADFVEKRLVPPGVQVYNDKS